MNSYSYFSLFTLWCDSYYAYKKKQRRYAAFRPPLIFIALFLKIFFRPHNCL